MSKYAEKKLTSQSSKILIMKQNMIYLFRPISPRYLPQERGHFIVTIPLTTINFWNRNKALLHENQNIAPHFRYEILQRLVLHRHSASKQCFLYRYKYCAAQCQATIILKCIIMMRYNMMLYHDIIIFHFYPTLYYYILSTFWWIYTSKWETFASRVLSLRPGWRR